MAALQFHHPESACDPKQRALPPLPTQAPRKKLQKTRQKHLQKPQHARVAPHHVPMTRSTSIMSGDSRRRLIPSDGSNRAHPARYPRSSQPRSVLRKRRADATRRSYHFVPARPGQQHPFPQQQQQQCQGHNNQGQDYLQPVSERGFPLNARHSVDASELFRLNNTPPPSAARRRWSMSDSASTSYIAVENSVGPSTAIVEKAKHKDLPPLPVQPEPTQVASTSNRRNSGLPPLPLYSESAPVFDDSYPRRLCYEFIQGERVYLDTLRQCVKNEDIFGTSLDLLLSLLTIIQVGEDFVTKMDSNPTPAGLGTSFLAVCKPLETALLRWSEEIARVSVEDVLSNNDGSKLTPAYPSPRRHSILKRVSTLWNRKPSRPTAAPLPSNAVKPDRVWQKQASVAGPGLWEMSVLPAQRVTQYRYFLRELLAALPQGHEAYSEVERASHAATFISQTVTRSQERPRT